MHRQTLNELCIANIRGDYPPDSLGYQSAEDALAELRLRTGMDFGLDADGWQSWLNDNPEVFPLKVSTVEEARKAARETKGKPS